jgi:hypothetical protein
VARSADELSQASDGYEAIPQTMERQSKGGSEMSEKVTLPREVAEAIDHIKHMGLHNIIECVVNMQYFDENTTPKLPFIRNYFKSDWRLLAEALIYGYEAEQTPEDKVRITFDHVLGQIEKLGDHPQAEHWKGMKTGIIVTLASLNIKISGVNQ